MSDRGSQPYFPWPIVVVAVLGVLCALGLDLPKPEGRYALGYALATLGAGGLVAVAVLESEDWLARALRWSLVLLSGLMIMGQGWPTAIAFGAVAFGLAWTRGGERRY